MPRRVLPWLLVLFLVACNRSAVSLTPATLDTLSTPATQVAASLGTAAPAPTTTPQPPVVLPTETPAPTNTPSPTPTPTTPPAVVEVAGATLAPGFSMTRYADMYRPTSLAFDAAGRLYATSFDGTVHVFVDSDGDARADVDGVFFAGFNVPLGVTVRPNTVDVYVSSFGKISILRDRDGDLVAEEAVNFVRDLPAGLHQNDNLKFGPDGRLYVGIGSTCDACVEADARSGTIMRFDPASGAGEVYATGMRNPYDLAFHPLTGDLFATDNGRDDLGLNTPLEELNHIVQGGDYGWPDCWDDLAGIGCAGTRPAIAFFEPRSSANSLDFYTGGHFPAEYQYNLFVAVFGSFLKDVTRGVARVELSPAGDSYTAETSWLARWPGMPLGLIAGPDGALYVGDYINGGIYRISYGS